MKKHYNYCFNIYLSVCSLVYPLICSLKKNKGQILLEVLWLMLFAVCFLAVISYLYEQGTTQIKNSRFTKYKQMYKKEQS